MISLSFKAFTVSLNCQSSFFIILKLRSQCIHLLAIAMRMRMIYCSSFNSDLFYRIISHFYINAIDFLVWQAISTFFLMSAYCFRFFQASSVFLFTVTSSLFQLIAQKSFPAILRLMAFICYTFFKTASGSSNQYCTFKAQSFANRILLISIGSFFMFSTFVLNCTLIYIFYSELDSKVRQKN